MCIDGRPKQGVALIAFPQVEKPLISYKSRQRMSLLVEAHVRRAFVAVATDPRLGSAKMKLLFVRAWSEPSTSDEVVAFVYPADLLSNRRLVRNRSCFVWRHV
jgi:hypothetical protein